MVKMRMYADRREDDPLDEDASPSHDNPLHALDTTSAVSSHQYESFIHSLQQHNEAMHRRDMRRDGREGFIRANTREERLGASQCALGRDDDQEESAAEAPAGTKHTTDVSASAVNSSMTSDATYSSKWSELAKMRYYHAMRPNHHQKDLPLPLFESLLCVKEDEEESNNDRDGGRDTTADLSFPPGDTGQSHNATSSAPPPSNILSPDNLQLRLQLINPYTNEISEIPYLVHEVVSPYEIVLLVTFAMSNEKMWNKCETSQFYYNTLGYKMTHHWGKSMRRDVVGVEKSVAKAKVAVNKDSTADDDDEQRMQLDSAEQANTTITDSNSSDAPEKSISDMYHCEGHLYVSFTDKYRNISCQYLSPQLIQCLMREKELEFLLKIKYQTPSLELMSLNHAVRVLNWERRWGHYKVTRMDNSHKLTPEETALQDQLETLLSVQESTAMANKHADASCAKSLGEQPFYYPALQMKLLDRIMEGQQHIKEEKSNKSEKNAHDTTSGHDSSSSARRRKTRRKRRPSKTSSQGDTSSSKTPSADSQEYISQHEVEATSSQDILEAEFPDGQVPDLSSPRSESTPTRQEGMQRDTTAPSDGVAMSFESDFATKGPSNVIAPSDFIIPRNSAPQKMQGAPQTNRRKRKRPQDVMNTGHDSKGDNSTMLKRKRTTEEAGAVSMLGEMAIGSDSHTQNGDFSATHKTSLHLQQRDIVIDPQATPLLFDEKYLNSDREWNRNQAKRYQNHIKIEFDNRNDEEISYVEPEMAGFYALLRRDAVGSRTQPC